MAKATLLDQFNRDLKTVKRAARLAATYWLTHGDGIDLTDETAVKAFREEAMAYAKTQFAKGSDGIAFFESTLTALFIADWQPGQYAEVA